MYKSFVLLDGSREKSYQVYKSFVLLDGSREKSYQLQVYKSFVLLGVSRKNPMCSLGPLKDFLRVVHAFKSDVTWF